MPYFESFCKNFHIDLSEQKYVNTCLLDLHKKMEAKNMSYVDLFGCQFEETEKRRLKEEEARLRKKHKRHMDELKAKNDAVVKELEQVHVSNQLSQRKILPLIKDLLQHSCIVYILHLCTILFEAQVLLSKTGPKVLVIAVNVLQCS